MDKHHAAHYVIAIALAGVASAGLWKATHQPRATQIIHVEPAGAGFAEAAPKPIRGAWPALGQDKTIRLGEALQKLGPTKVTIFCVSERCKALMADLDDAFQIAGWDDDQVTGGAFGIEEVSGVIVGPAGPKAESLRVVLSDILATPVEVANNMRVDTDLGLIIGKMPK